MTTAQLGESGIVLNETDEYGVFWSLQEGSDLFGASPTPRVVTGDRVSGHGSWDATEYFTSRSWTVEGFAYAPDHETLHRARVRWERAIGLHPFKVTGVEPGFERFAWFRRDGSPLFNETDPTTARFSASLFGADPRLYSSVEKQVSMGFPSTTGGLVWPAQLPWTWTATVVNGEAMLDNDGTCTAYPVWRIDGPVTEPSIVNAETGEAMHFDLALAAGEWLIVDVENHQVLANGDVQASRRDKFWGTWWGLAPQTSTPVIARFGGSSGAAGALLSATWRDTYI